MRFRRSPSPTPAGKINVTPLIDVVMCLIVFYLIVGKLAADKKARVALPKSDIGHVERDGKDLTITIVGSAGSPEFYVEGKPTAIDAIETLLRGRAEGTGVQVRADRRLPFADVSPVIDACRRVGLASVKLTAERTSPGGIP